LQIGRSQEEARRAKGRAFTADMANRSHADHHFNRIWKAAAVA